MTLRNLFAVLLFLAISPISQAATSNDYYVAGFGLYAQHEYEKAIPYLKEALRQDPTLWKAAQLIGYSYYFLHQEPRALEYFDQSLSIHADNFEVWNLAETIRARLIWEAERADPYPRVFRKPPTWIQVDLGAATASLGDMAKAPAAFIKNNPAYSPGGSLDGFGPMVDLEVGFMLDTLDAWGMDFNVAAFNGYRGTASDSTGQYLEVFQPTMIAVQPEYMRFFKLGSFRLFAKGGAGLYNTLVNVNITYAGVTQQAGQVGGVGFGGFLGGGFELAIDDEFSASAFLRGRWATTDNIHGDGIEGVGAGQNLVLSFDPSGQMGLNPSSLIGTPGYTSAKVDYTGGDLGLSFSYHY
ncbi:MAG TPA: hypothetical protein VHE12_07750 [bacterium]|nr:hypothetical protein [bacterium]